MPTWTENTRKEKNRGDLIETYKIVTGKERVDKSMFFRMAGTKRRLRGQSMKIYKPRCQTTRRQNWFSVRTVDQWNRLPQFVVDADTVNNFKDRLDKHWRSDMGN